MRLIAQLARNEPLRLTALTMSKIQFKLCWRLLRQSARPSQDGPFTGSCEHLLVETSHDFWCKPAAWDRRRERY
jgi:hypothetical protein